MNGKLFLPVLTAALMFPLMSSAETYYVQPAAVKVMSRGGFDAEVLGTVFSGYQLSSTGKAGHWVKFSYGGRDGFINAAQLLTSPPLARKALAGEEAGHKLSSRQRSSSQVAVAGVKGLTYEDRSRASGRERADYAALEKMESFKVRPDEVKAFQEGGKP